MAPYIPPHRRGRRQQAAAAAENTSTRKEEDLYVLNNAFHRICCINLDARIDKWKLIQRDAEKVGISFQQRIERFSAVEGNNQHQQQQQQKNDDDDVCLEWDGTMDAKYNRHGRPGPRTMTPSEVGCALSHIQLWRQLVQEEQPMHNNPNPAMLILEDDARFSQVRGRSRFATAFAKAWKLLPEDWGFFI